MNPPTAIDLRADRVHAFLHETDIALAPSGAGLLDGLTVGIKDLFDIAGQPTGFGNPSWRALSPIPSRHASAVQALLDNGASIVGKTHTDEFAFSLTGNNFHYGAPLNSAAPDRYTGGSSCGSAAAVAAGLCDFALGTDTGGSVRAPASFCGLYGLRPTHEAVSRAGVCALAPSFDTVGWFARDAHTLDQVGQVLLPPDSWTARETHVAFLDAAWRLVEAGDADAVRQQALQIAQSLGEVRLLDLAPSAFDAWFDAFRTLQFAEVAATLGPWIDTHRPPLGPGVAERFAAAREVTHRQIGQAEAMRQTATAWLDEELERSEFLVLPTAPGAAPRRDAPVAEMEAYRRTAMRILALAGLARCPQISLPLLRADGLPLGLSILGRRGSDRRLLALARRLEDRWSRA